MKNKLILSLSLACVIFAIILILDLISKHFIFIALPNIGDNKDFINGFINFIHVENSGAAWGMLAGRPVFLILVSLVILIIYLWFYYLRLKKHKGNTSLVLSISVGFIVGGCVGNLIDRVVFGYVRDFINFQFIEFPVFNVADISLTVGIVIMIVYFIFIYSKEDKMREMLMKDLENFRDKSEIVDILDNSANDNKFEKDLKNDIEIVEINKEKQDIEHRLDNDFEGQHNTSQKNDNEDNGNGR